MPEFAFVGDPHGDFGFARELARERPDAVIILGDLDLAVPLERAVAPLLDARVEVYWIHGNHDVDHEAWHDHLFGSTMADRNLHARVVEIAGVRVAGLGGTFSSHVWNPRSEHGPRYRTRADFIDAHERLLERDRFAAKVRLLDIRADTASALVTHASGDIGQAIALCASSDAAERKRLAADLAAIEAEIEQRYGKRVLHDRGQSAWRGGLPLTWRATIFPSDVDALAGLQADVLVAHEAPSCCIVPRLGDGLPFQFGHALLDELAEGLGARLVVHGHHHVDYNGQVLDGIQVRGVGQAKVWRTTIAPRGRR